MKRLLFQAVFLATGMIMGVYASGDVGNTRRVRGWRWR